MDRTLFFPFMLDTYKACRRAYKLAQKKFSSRNQAGSNSRSLSSICKQFVRKGVSEINRGKIRNNNQLQLFIGQHWPVEELEKHGFSQDQIARSFLYVYKTLLYYVRCPYIPEDAEVVASGQKVRAKVHQARVYIEDTIELILWYPEKQHLEIVDFRLQLPQKVLLKQPRPSHLARHFLANKLKIRWPFKTLSITTIKLTPKGMYSNEIELLEDTFNNNWDDIVRDLQDMKTPSSNEEEEGEEPHKRSDNCSFCMALDNDNENNQSADEDLSMSA